MSGRQAARSGASPYSRSIGTYVIVITAQLARPVAAIMPAYPPPTTTSTTAAPTASGYRLTAHVRSYYRSTAALYP